jgi:hypothetical protein
MILGVLNSQSLLRIAQRPSANVATAGAVKRKASRYCYAGRHDSHRNGVTAKALRLCPVRVALCGTGRCGGNVGMGIALETAKLSAVARLGRPRLA